MQESSKNNLKLFISRYKNVGDVMVGISFSSKGSGCCFNRLSGVGACCNASCFPEFSEETCLLYAIYLNVNNSLCGDPKAANASKVSSVNCCLNNNNFGISWHVKGTVSAVRKSLGIALKAIVPAKLYSSYSKCIKSVGGSTSREVFNYVANECNNSIKNEICCGAVGNIKVKSKDVLNNMLSVMVNKVKLLQPEGKKEKPSGHSSCDWKSQVYLQCTGVSQLIVSDYIQAKAKIQSMQENKGLVVLISDKSWKGLSVKLKAQTKEYVNIKYKPVGDELGNVVAYAGLGSGKINCYDAKQVIKNLTAGDVENIINKCLS